MFHSSDLPALAQAQRVLLTPLAYPSPEAWAHQALRALQDVFRSERAVLTLGGLAAPITVTADVGARALLEYEADHVDDDEAGDLVVSLDTPYYVETDLAGHDVYRAHTASAAYNEWYRPNGLTDAVGLFVTGSPRHAHDLYARYDVPIVANVLLASSPLSSDSEADHARDLLAVVHPALSAAVRTLHRTEEAGASIGAAIDGVDAAAWLFGADGDLLHESAAAARLTAARSGSSLTLAAGRLAADLVLARRRALPSSPTATVVLDGAATTLVGTYLRPSSRRDPAVLVSVAAPPRLAARGLCERFGLTPRQAEVALLLADRLSNREVAAALHVSPHTARRHTRAVLEALGVGDRREVAGTLQRR